MTHDLHQHDLTACGLLGTRLENADIISPQSWPVNQQRRWTWKTLVLKCAIWRRSRAGPAGSAPLPDGRCLALRLSGYNNIQWLQRWAWTMHLSKNRNYKIITFPQPAPNTALGSPSWAALIAPVSNCLISVGNTAGETCYIRKSTVWKTAKATLFCTDNVTACLSYLVAYYLFVTLNIAQHDYCWCILVYNLYLLHLSLYFCSYF